jgi:8-oxo-dGTP pyrophosphatase MutT (NUDIX family)
MLLRHAPAAPEVLLIERARREGDPWSGHMAFPGGRVEISDESVQRAAERETFEEVGIDLAGAELLGRLDDLEGRDSGRTLPLVISAFVYHVHEPAPIEPGFGACPGIGRSGFERLDFSVGAERSRPRV